MSTRTKCCDTRDPLTGRDSLIAVGLTLGTAMIVAAIMTIGDSDLTETIGLVMIPGVLSIGTQFIALRRRSATIRLVGIAGPLLLLFLIGLVTGLVAARL